MRWARRVAIALAALVALLAAVVLGIDTDVGRRFVADRIGTVETDNGLRFAVGRIDGSLYGRAVLRDVRVRDPQGLVFTAPVAVLDWRPWRWFANRLEIRALHIPTAIVARSPRLRETGRRGPILPDFDIAIGRLAIDRLLLAPAVTGVARRGRIAGTADIRAGRARIALDALVEGSDRLRLRLDAEPARDRLVAQVAARGAARGVLARLSGLPGPIAIDLDGGGRWAAWQGGARIDAAGARLADLRLAARAGEYTLSGTLAPATITRGRVQRLTAPRILANGRATLADRRLAGSLSLRSAALAVETTGTLDLAASAFRNVRIAARLIRPEALFRNMSGRDIALRAILDGPFATARFDYRLAAARFAFDRTGFEQARASGRGRLSPAPVALPIRFTAARVTGVGDVAGGILRNLSVDGVLRVTPRLVTGDGLRLRSDRLSGRIGLMLDLRTGRYDVGLEGALGRYLIPGLGVVDVTSRLSVVPGAGGRGTRVVGTGTAIVRRLDNAFFRTLAGGLPRIATRLERGADGVLHFRDLVLTGPAIRLAGNGYRRRDGTFVFAGSGTQARYGPVVLSLDGRIDRPRIDLRLARPSPALGLTDVVARLDPDPAGFAFMARGGSRLGPFEADGRILLPRGADAAIAFSRLDVSGTRASGRLAIGDGGFDGTLAVAGGGIDGTVALAPAGAVQRIAVALAARRATIAGAYVGRGRLEATLLLDPSGAIVEATASAFGLRRGSIRLARLAANVQLRGETGTVRASVSGSRGRGFALSGVGEIAPGRIVLTGGGTVDRRPIALAAPAVLTREGAGWRLAPARLTLAGGGATVGGRFGGDETAIEANLTAMPLAVLDIAYPGLALGGSASGTIALAARDGAAPTGRMALTVRGLARAGLVRSARPIDLGIAGLLQADRAAVRAVLASGGKTVGRMQALLTPGADGSLLARPGDARLFAQLRYAGPADPLWRLTGIELFELSGPVSVAADASGRLIDPRIRGTVRASGARIESAATGTVLSNIEASGRFAGSRLAIERFTAAAGREGRVTGTGAFEFAGAGGVGLDLRLQAERASMIARDDIAATVTGPLVIRSAGAGGTISGTLRVDASRYRLGRATAATALPQLNLKEINLPGGREEEETPPPPWTLDIRARAPGNLTVSGLGLASEWSADVRIGGEPTNPAITGTARLVRGDYEFAGREFELTRGVLRFGGEVPANPALDIEANASGSGLTATIRVTGAALRPEIAFTSIPALPQDELLSRLLFGTTITNLSAPEALQLAAAVAALRDGGDGLNPINAVRRAAGLDRLRILPADPQTGQGTSIAAGKYVTRRLYAEIVTDGQGYSATRVEYQVTRWLSLLSSISTLGRQSANVRVSRDY